MPTVKNPNKIEVYKVESKSLHLCYYPILHPELILVHRATVRTVQLISFQIGLG